MKKLTKVELATTAKAKIDDAMTVYDFYNSLVKENETVLEEHANKSLNLI